MIDEELLWKAWPDGYLAMGGVRSVEGFVYMGDGVWVETESMANGPTATVLPYEDRFSPNVQAGERDTLACLEAGYFLPNVDPEDIATWACLLADLAEAGGMTGRERLNLMWRRQERPSYHPEHERVVWLLYSAYRSGRAFFIDTDDPALALVLARIDLRENGS